MSICYNATRISYNLCASAIYGRIINTNIVTTKLYTLCPPILNDSSIYLSLLPYNLFSPLQNTPNSGTAFNILNTATINNVIRRSPPRTNSLLTRNELITD